MSVNGSLSGLSFQHQLAYGQMAETEIAQWLMSNGAIILPIYDREYQIDSQKIGPRLFAANGVKIVAPDLLVWSLRAGIIWIEAKHKTVFTRWRIGNCWETGIDRRLWKEYQRIVELTELPVWLTFLHRCSTPSKKDLSFSGCPKECPTGLFAGEINELASCISHEDPRHGKTGMVYWAHKSLKYLATLDQVMKVQEKRKVG